MVSQEVIQDAVRRLVDEAQPKMVILFGSYARGNAGEHSDLDFLVVLAEVKSRRAEMVRLGQVLRPLRIPVDVLVVSQEQLEAWGASRTPFSTRPYPRGGSCMKPPDHLALAALGREGGG